jgi:hypothetical protein
MMTTGCFLEILIIDSTFITELSLAHTSHMIAICGFLNRNLATRTPRCVIVYPDGGRFIDRTSDGLLLRAGESSMQWFRTPKACFGMTLGAFKVKGPFYQN